MRAAIIIVRISKLLEGQGGQVPCPLNTAKEGREKKMLLPDLNFATINSLKPIEIVITEASRALKDQDRVISSSEIANVLRITLQTITEADISFRAIYAYGTSKSSNLKEYIPSEDVAGTFISSHLPYLTAANLNDGLLALVGSIFFLVFRRKKIKQKEQILYDEAMAIEKSLRNRLLLEANASQERIDYLKSILALLTYALKELKRDLTVLKAN